MQQGQLENPNQIMVNVSKLKQIQRELKETIIKVKLEIKMTQFTK